MKKSRTRNIVQRYNLGEDINKTGNTAAHCLILFGRADALRDVAKHADGLFGIVVPNDLTDYNNGECKKCGVEIRSALRRDDGGIFCPSCGSEVGIT